MRKAGDRLDLLNHALSLGLDLERIQSMLSDGLTMQEIVDAVQRMQSRGEAVDNIADTVKPNDYSDAGNAEVFIARNRGRMVYTDSRGWLIWDGKRWAADDHKAHQIAVQLSGEMLADAQAEYQAALFNQAAVKAAEAANEEPNPEATERTANEVKKAKAYLSHALQFRNERRIKAMMELAKHELAVDPAILDANPMELNTPKGIVDLPTGQIRPHDAQAHCTYMTAVGPGTDGMEMWIDFLNAITEGDGSLMGFLQMVAGMALYGKVYEEKLVLAHGSGRNGKSTLFNSLGAVLGDYCGVIDIETITTSRDNKGPDLIELRGKRLVLAGELEEGRRLSVSTVKKICSTDRITAAAKFRQPETFTPSHTLILHSNHLPRVGSNDNGTWRRLLPVEFKARIPEGTGVSNYGDVLVEKAGPAILTWMLQGAVNFAQNGYKLTIPDVVEMAVEDYRQRENWLENFLSERCILEPDARAPAGELYQVYRQWAEESGDYVRRQIDFNIAMEQRGFSKITPKNKRTWIGLKLDYQQKYAALG